MGAIDASIVNVALPHIRGSVGATLEEITWITTGYIIANVIVMPLTGFLGRFFGQKRIYMFCLALFLFGSILCGMARTLPMLVAFRIIQGLGAGALQPTEQAILRSSFPPEEQGMAMALFAMAVMVGPAVGPALGGWITDNYSWPWIFYINIPVGILGLFMVWRFVHEAEDLRELNRQRAEQQRKNMDWSGIILMTVGLGALQYLLEEGNRLDWFSSGTILICAFVAVFFLIAFVIRELTAPVPAVNLALFKDRTFASGTAIGAVMFAMLMGSMFLLPVFMQEVLGFTATQSGVALIPRTLIMIVCTPIVGKLYNKVHPAIMVGIGIVCFAIGAYGFSHLTRESGTGDILQPMLVTGVGFSCLFVPLTTAAFSRIPRPLLADATGMNSLLRQVGASIGLAIFASLLTRYSVEARAAVGSHVSYLNPLAMDRLHMISSAMVARGIDPVSAQTAAIGALKGQVAVQGVVMSFDKSFLLQGISFLCVIPLLIFLKVDRSKPAPKMPAHVE
jgi:DHA2 family multidrug resistance protein